MSKDYRGIIAGAIADNFPTVDDYDSQEPKIENYLMLAHTELNSLLTTDLIRKLSSQAATLMRDLCQWLSGYISLNDICVHNTRIMSSPKTFSIDNLVGLIFTTAQIFEYSRDVNELRFSAQLKRLGKFIQGNIALKDL